MHPILAEQRRIGMYLLVFAQAGLVLAEVLRVLTGADRWEVWLLTLPPLLIHAFSCLASWYLCRAQPLGRTAPAAVLGAQAVSALVAGGLLALVGRAWAAALGASAQVLYRSTEALVFVFGVFL
ncbi:MAG: hypothetical protein MI919_19520, partial [Holophagales bacterium]|nr:hypothetical protein [Holophagales bacterium]